MSYFRLRTSSKLHNTRQICFLGKGNDGLSVFTFRNRWVSLSPWSPWQTDCYQSSTWWSVIKVVMWNRRTKSCSNVSAAYLGEMIFEVVCRIFVCRTFVLMFLNFTRYFFQDIKAQADCHLISILYCPLSKESKQNEMKNGLSFRIWFFKICKIAGVYNVDNTN